MTWRGLLNWLEEQELLLDTRPFPDLGPAQLLAEEQRHRARTDDWILAAYLEDRSPPLDEDLRRWVTLRLQAAFLSLHPVVMRAPHEVIDLHTELRRLLLEDWHRDGPARLAAQVQAAG